MAPLTSHMSPGRGIGRSSARCPGDGSVPRVNTGRSLDASLEFIILPHPISLVDHRSTAVLALAPTYTKN
ncbi:hypothetical protein VTN96DRAFT_9481 [Rasamsonia emersonii]